MIICYKKKIIQMAWKLCNCSHNPYGFFFYFRLQTLNLTILLVFFIFIFTLFLLFFMAYPTSSSCLLLLLLATLELIQNTYSFNIVIITYILKQMRWTKPMVSLTFPIAFFTTPKVFSLHFLSYCCNSGFKIPFSMFIFFHSSMVFFHIINW